MISEELKNLITSANKSDCNLIIGRKDTGKSTYLINIIEGTDKQEIIFVSPKIKQYQVIKEEKTVLLMNDYILFKSGFLHKEPENMLIIFDDSKYYINVNPNETNTRQIFNFLRNSRHANNSIYSVFHSFSEVNEQFFSLIDKIILFKTTDNITKFKNLFTNYDIVEKSFNKINNHKDDHINEIIEV